MFKSFHHYEYDLSLFPYEGDHLNEMVVFLNSGWDGGVVIVPLLLWDGSVVIVVSKVDQKFQNSLIVGHLSRSN